jgi:hypothetical protein
MTALGGKGTFVFPTSLGLFGNNGGCAAASKIEVQGARYPENRSDDWPLRAPGSG